MTHLTTLRLAVAAASAALAFTAAAMPPAEAWEIGPLVRGRNYSVGMPAQPSPARGGGLSIELPLAGEGQVDALTTAIAPLASARQITVRYRIDAAPGTRFVPDEQPDEPATVSLYFQRRGDTWSGRGRYESHRWYSPARAVVPLAAGEYTMTVRFDDVWTNVQGRPNTQVPAAYAAALDETARFGIAFGTSSRRSHGVYATGPARFTLLAFDIE